MNIMAILHLITGGHYQKTIGKRKLGVLSLGDHLVDFQCKEHTLTRTLSGPVFDFQQHSGASGNPGMCDI